MMNFTDSALCRAQSHCVYCRSLHLGKTWRRTMGQHFRMPAGGECPRGKPMVEDDPSTKPAEVRPPQTIPPRPMATTAAPAAAGEFDFIYRRQEICLACDQFKARLGNCVVSGVTCGPCFRKVRANRCPRGKW